MKPMNLMKAIGEIDDSWILEAAPKGTLPSKKHAWFNMKAFAGVMAVLLMGVILGIHQNNTPAVNDAVPFVSCESMEEAQSAAGFTMEYPENWQDSTPDSFAVYNGNMIEIQYADSKGQRTLCVRKAQSLDDISGDYTVYENEIQWSEEEITYTAKGNDGLYSLILWTHDQYSYSIYFEEAVTETEARELVTLID